MSAAGSPRNAPASEAPLVSVVVLNWNGAEMLRRCLPSVLRLDYPNYEVILADNGSEDDSVAAAEQMAAAAGREINIVRNTANLGANRGRNTGAAHARGKYIWLLDNDIDVERQALRVLVEFMERHPRCGLAGPLLLNRTAGDVPEGSGMLFIPGGVVLEIQKVRRHISSNEPVLVGTVVANSTFLRAEAWREVGGYEPVSPFCMDDVDLGPRIWSAGWAVAMVPRAVAYHHPLSRRSRRKNRWAFRNFAPGVLRAMLRNFRLRNALLALPAFCAILLLKTLKQAIWQRDPLLPFHLVPALLTALGQLPESLRQRRRVQAARRVPEDRFLRPWRYAEFMQERNE